MTTPYIGSKISLISRLDIRYEGTLFSVDPVESTIALSQGEQFDIRSFGTEDRPAPVHVPAQPTIYESIIFKASDIKDLIVCETKEPPKNVNDITYDPAIVSVSKPPGQAQLAGTEKIVEESQEEASSPPQPKHAVPPHYVPPQESASAFSAPPPQQSYRSAVTGGGGGQQASELSGGFGQRTGPRSYYRGLDGQSQPNQQQMGPLPNNPVYPQQQQQQNRQYFPRNQQPQEYHYQGQNRRGASGATRQQPQHYRPQQQQPPQRPRFDGDFDFEKANEQFQHTIGDIGETLGMLGLNEGEKASPIQYSSARESEERSVSGSEKTAISNATGKKPAENFYDKSKSFFDNISCDALEREEGKNNRVDWKKERMTNQETFGQMTVRSMHFQRGRGGGYRNYNSQYPQRNHQQQQQQRYGGGGGGFAPRHQQPQPQRQQNY